MIKFILLVVLVLLIAIVVAAVKLLPWWGAALVLVGLLTTLVYGVPALVRAVFKRTLFGLMEGKSRVLRGARVTIHTIERVAPLPVDEAGPDDDDADVESIVQDEVDAEADEEDQVRRQSLRWYRVDATIEPQDTRGPMNHWEPGELQVVPFDRKVDIRSFDELSALEDTDESEDQEWTVEQVRLLDGGREVEDEDYKYDRPLQLRLWFALPPDAPRRLKFRYYFESFGDLALPG